MKQQYNWILVKNLKGEDTKVRQNRAYGEIFVDEQGNEYMSRNIDFTSARLAIPDFNERNKENLNALKDMMKSMDANAIADHKAKIDEREYWRKLRGEIFKMVFDATPDDRGTMEGVLEYTKKYFDAIYNQDQEFFKEKYND